MNRRRSASCPSWRWLVPAVAVVALILAACDTGDGTTLRLPTAPTTLPPPTTSDPLSSNPLSSNPLAADDGVVGDDSIGLGLYTPWPDGGPIDLRYTCDGINVAPAISWDGVPADTAEIAVALVDETNLSNGRPFIHWVIAGIDPSIRRLDEGEVPAGAVQGLNFFGAVGYTGPCPAPDSTSTYTMTVFALNQQTELADGTPAAQLLDLIGTVAIDSVSSTGTATR